MRITRTKQNGFGLAGVLIVIGALALIGGLIAYTYHRIHTEQTNSVHAKNTSVQGQASTDKQDDKASITNTSAENQTSKSKQNTTSPTISHFTIKEWGVQATYNGPLSLQYSANSSGSMSLSSSQLAAGGPDVCAAAGNSDAGILNRYLPTDSNLGPKIPANETAEQYIEQNATVSYAKVGSYIYIYWGNNYVSNGVYNGPCTDKTTGLQTVSAFSALVQELQALQR